MNHRRWVLAACLVVATRWGSPASAETVAKTLDGAALYQRHCAPCHGPGGRGDGPDATMFSARPANLRDGRLTRHDTDALVKRVREGAPLPLALDANALRTHTAKVEDLVGYLRRLPQIDWHLAMPGWDAFAARCQVCHGPLGTPTGPLPAGVRPPRDLADPKVQRSLTDKQVTAAVRHGRRGMPALTPRVSIEKARELASFVRLLSPGFSLYTSQCAACHGDDGRGVADLGEAIRLPKVVFDQAYFAQHDAEQLRASAWHMLAQQQPAMPHYRWTLSEAQVRAIVEYLQRTEPRVDPPR